MERCDRCLFGPSSYPQTDNKRYGAVGGPCLSLIVLTEVAMCFVSFCPCSERLFVHACSSLQPKASICVARWKLGTKTPN
eukprot:4351243-Amphidinium_carterae.1